MILRELSSDKNPKKFVRKFVRKRFLSEKRLRERVFLLTIPKPFGYNVFMEEDIQKRARSIVEYMIGFFGEKSSGFTEWWGGIDERVGTKWIDELSQLVAIVIEKEPYRWFSHHASAMGKKGGTVSSEAKTRAARENAKKGGRPRKDRSGE